MLYIYHIKPFFKLLNTEILTVITIIIRPNLLMLRYLHGVFTFITAFCFLVMYNR